MRRDNHQKNSDPEQARNAAGWLDTNEYEPYAIRITNYTQHEWSVYFVRRGNSNTLTERFQSLTSNLPVSDQSVALPIIIGTNKDNSTFWLEFRRKDGQQIQQIALEPTPKPRFGNGSTLPKKDSYDLYDDKINDSKSRDRILVESAIWERMGSVAQEISSEIDAKQDAKMKNNVRYDIAPSNTNTTNVVESVTSAGSRAVASATTASAGIVSTAVSTAANAVNNVTKAVTKPSLPLTTTSPTGLKVFIGNDSRLYGPLPPTPLLSQRPTPPPPFLPSQRPTPNPSLLKPIARLAAPVVYLGGQPGSLDAKHNSSYDGLGVPTAPEAPKKLAGHYRTPRQLPRIAPTLFAPTKEPKKHRRGGRGTRKCSKGGCGCSAPLQLPEREEDN